MRIPDFVHKMLSVFSAFAAFQAPLNAAFSPAAAHRAAAVSMGSPDEFTLAVLGDLHVSATPAARRSCSSRPSVALPPIRVAPAP